MPVFNYSDYADDLRNVICSNPIATSVTAANCAASSQIPTFPRMRIRMDADSIRNTLESMAPNAVLGDLAATREIHIRPRSRERAAMSHPDVLRKLEDDYRKWEVERIKKLISSKATIRYSIEVK